MEAGTAFQIIALLVIGGIGSAVLFRYRQKGEAKQAKLDYYRRLVTDLRNAERHFAARREGLAGLMGLEPMAARALLEDAKFASRDMITYAPSEFYRITEAEAERMLALTLELKAADSAIEACQEAALAGSNTLPALHDDLMRRVDRITADAGVLTKALKPRMTDYYWSR